MARSLFVYGTLRDPDLLLAVLNRPLSADSMLAAMAPGFRTVTYPSRIYPALVRAPGSSAEGLLLTGLTPFECDLLDTYEGDEYRREILPIIVGEELHEAMAYLPAIAIPANAEPWTLAAWQALHKPKILAAERENLDLLRQKLIALRPH